MSKDEFGTNWIGTYYGSRDSFVECLRREWYSKYQLEKCPTTGREHIQFFVRTNRVRFSHMRKVFGNAHIERCKSVDRAINYCSKVDTRIEGPYEHGVLEGNRGVDPVSSLVDQSVKRFLETASSSWRNVRALQSIRMMVMPKRQQRTDLVFFYGETGRGKTKIVDKISKYLGYEDVYGHDGSQWWDNYDAQPMVVVDEYRGQFPVQNLLKMGDYTPWKVPYKGGYAEFSSRLVFFMSNLPPAECLYKYDGATNSAVSRRFQVLEVY